MATPPIVNRAQSLTNSAVYKGCIRKSNSDYSGVDSFVVSEQEMQAYGVDYDDEVSDDETTIKWQYPK